MNEADKDGAIIIIKKVDYVQDCILILAVNSTCQKTTTDMMETHNEEDNDINSNMSPNNGKHISQLFPVKAVPGAFHALPKQHKLSHLKSTKTNTLTTDGN